ncbi:hypothetical protein EDB89DRAFT_2233802 [Lactarius sanguifluus]|nr:hypothetical protein EDB89DRAFT_2233802 [Lactarius sanguifluus]
MACNAPRPATPLQRDTQRPSNHRPPRHPDMARNTPSPADSPVRNTPSPADSPPRQHPATADPPRRPNVARKTPPTRHGTPTHKTLPTHHAPSTRHATPQQPPTPTPPRHGAQHPATCRLIASLTQHVPRPRHERRGAMGLSYLN